MRRAKIAKQSNTSAPKYSHSSLTVQTGERALDAYTKLSPLAQHELTALRPGEFNTPFVEANGVASKLATCVINGLWSQDFSSSSLADKYVVATVCPMASVSNVPNTISSGVGLVYASGSNVMTFATARGATFTDTYGATTFASKMIPYATRAEIVVDIPLGNVAGEIWVGSLPLSSFIGTSVNNLIKNSTKTIDGKSLMGGNKVELKAAINDRSLIHFVNNLEDAGTPVEMSNAGELAEEWIAYAVFSKKFATAYDGSQMGFTMNLTAHTNAVWWPAVNTPALNGVVAKAAPSTAALTLAQDHFSKVAESYLADPRPFSMKSIMSVAGSLLSKAESIPGIGVYASAAKGLVSLAQHVLSTPHDGTEDYSSLISDLEWFNSVVDQKWLGYRDPDINLMVDNWIEASDELLELIS